MKTLEERAGNERIERAIRRIVVELMDQGLTFSPADVVDRLAGEVSLGRVTALLARLERAGFLRPFRYRRAFASTKTSAGVLTSMVFCPVEESTKGTAPPRPLPPLPIRRRLLRQTAALRESVKRTAREMIEAGTLLSAVESLLGRSEAGRYFEGSLGMSREAARRLIRIAGTFRHHPRLEAIALARPTLLYELSEPSFPSELRERILSDRLVVDGERRPFAALRVRDVTRARKQWVRADAERSALQRRIASLDPTGPELEEKLRRVTASRGHVVTTPDPRSEVERRLERVIRETKAIADSAASLPAPLRNAGRKALEDLLERLV